MRYEIREIGYMKNEKYILPAVLGVFLILSFRRKDETEGSETPFVPGSGSRGMRNNNPGNIKISPTNWKGKVPAHLNTDGIFEQFYTIDDGIRASLVNLTTYYNRYQLRTIRGIISRWAPASENPLSSYIDFAVSCMNRHADENLQVDAIPYLANCIFVFENRPHRTPGIDEILRIWHNIL